MASSDPFALLSASSAAPTPAAATAPQLPLLLSADKAKGVTLYGRLARQGGQIVYNMGISNGAGMPVDGFMIQTNKCSFGVSPTNQVRRGGRGV